MSKEDYISICDKETGNVVDKFVKIQKPIKNAFKKGDKLMFSQDELLSLTCSEGLSGTEMLVFMTLVGDAEYGNVVHIQQSEIAKHMGVNRSTVSKAVKVLESKSIIEKDKTRRSKQAYTISPAICWKGGGANHQQAIKVRMKKAGMELIQGGAA